MEKMITGSSVLFFDGSGSVAYEKKFNKMRWSIKWGE